MHSTVSIGLVAFGLLGSVIGAGADNSALSACRAVPDDAARLACYDVLADAPTAPAATPPSPETLFGRDAVQSDEIVRQAAGIDQLDELQLRVVSARADPLGKAVLAFDNGQVWAQLDSPPARIKPGEDVRIRRAALGSYLLLREGGGRGIRVRRIN